MSRRTARRSALAGAGLAAMAVVLSGCTPADIPSMLDMSKPVTKEGERIYSLWQGSWVAAWIVGAITWGLILWAVVAYRRRVATAPPQTRYNLPIEAMYTVLPLIVIAVLFGYTARDQTQILKVSAHPDNNVNVVAFRWSWTFNYLDQNAYDVGTPQELPTLYLPVNETVKFTLTSPDVIHSFWIPSFLFKMDVIPGKANQFELTPDQDRDVLGQVRGAVRCRPLADAVRREGGQRRRLREAHGRPEGQRSGRAAGDRPGHRLGHG